MNLARLALAVPLPEEDQCGLRGIDGDEVRKKSDRQDIAARQHQRWFRRALRWRAGCEATISTLKHPFSMVRATYKGEYGFQRYVGWCVITKNLCAIARWQTRRTRHRRC